jgi:hypothetical protein
MFICGLIRKHCGTFARFGIPFTRNRDAHLSFLLLASGDFMKHYRLFFIVVLITHDMGFVAIKKNKGNEL